MSRWYVLFLSLVTVLAVLGLAGAGAFLHKQYPNVWIWSAVASVLVAAGSIKAILEVAKLASDLQKAQLELSKLPLEIEELQAKKAERSAVIVKPTKDEIEKYDTNRVGGELLRKVLREVTEVVRPVITAVRSIVRRF